MADNKKYYYIKLKENYFDQDSVKILESYEDGYIYSLIIIKLYLKAAKNNGCLMMTPSIPYNPKNVEILARVIGHEVSHVKKAIQAAIELELLTVVDDKEMWMTEIQNFIGSSSTEADRIREYRNSLKKCKNVQLLNNKSTTNEQQKSNDCSKKELQNNENNKKFKNVTDSISGKKIEKMGTDVHEFVEKKPKKNSLYKCTPEIEIEKDIEIDIDIKKEIYKEKKIEKNKNLKIENDIKFLFNQFKEICVSLPKPSKLTDLRKRAFKSRLKEYDKETILEVFRKAQDSDFISGRNGKWPNASLDWIIKPSNFIKILEGNYDNKEPPIVQFPQPKYYRYGSSNDVDRLLKNGF